jgi:hypothetical protein
VACEQSTWPQCGGTCPPDEHCVEDPSGVQGCICEPLPCEQTFWPECGGTCPNFDEVCANVPGSDFCECVPLGRPCEDTFAPQCNGWCPPDEGCVELPGTPNCECQPCEQVPPGEVVGVHWLDSDILRWSNLVCARVYNVYRLVGPELPDAPPPGDNVADTYGSCFAPDLLIPEVVDGSVPPLQEIQFYTVTGENAVGEGTMGWTSYGVQRPNVTPCP